MRASTGNTGRVPRRPTVRSIKKGWEMMSEICCDMLYNSSVQSNIPRDHPRTLPL